jgi:hypothetical protein
MRTETQVIKEDKSLKGLNIRYWMDILIYMHICLLKKLTLTFTRDLKKFGYVWNTRPCQPPFTMTLSTAVTEPTL